MNFKIWLEQSNILFFLRVTRDPQNDLKRGWSCHNDAWAYSREEAYDNWIRLNNPNLPEPKMDHQYKAINWEGKKLERWCFLVERGLSSFAFWNEKSFERAKRKLNKYVNSFGSDQIIHVFKSDKYHLKSGSDGEDLFVPGDYITPIKYTDNWQNIISYLQIN